MTPPAYLSAALDRLDPDDGVWITTTAEEALRAAAAPVDGPLAGTTFAVKDLIDTAGVRTTYGSRIYDGHVPVATAGVVRRLERLGSISLGKTNLNEFAFGVSGFNPHYGMIRSPLDRALSAGGSSGGSAAAVGLGVVDLAIGTDTTGSARIPAACCGVIGFKSAWGSLPLDGVYPLAPNTDSIGFFVRDIAVLAAALGIARLPGADVVRTSRIVDRRELDLPPLPDAHHDVFRHQAVPLHRERCLADPTTYGRDIRRKLQAPAEGDFWGQWAEVLAWRQRFITAAAGVDILCGPVIHGAVPAVADVMAEYESDGSSINDRLQVHAAVASTLGWPAIAVPTEDGPVELMARPGAEPLLLAAARGITLTPAEQLHPA